MSSEEGVSEEGMIIVQLLEEASTHATRQWLFPQSQTIQIGRQSENDIVLKHAKVSRHHASIFHDGQSWTCACFGENGVRVGEKKLSHVRLQSGMILEFARSGPKLLFEMPPNIADDNSRGSVTFLIEHLKQGHKGSAHELWARCMATMIQLSTQSLEHSKSPRKGEDIADSVFGSLIFGSERRRLPELTDRKSLWRLILKMVARKSGDAVSGDPSTDSEITAKSLLPAEEQVDQFLSVDPTPASMEAVEEQAKMWLDRLPDRKHRQVAALTLEGYSCEEISKRVHVPPEDVLKMEHRIRRLWAGGSDDSES